MSDTQRLQIEAELEHIEANPMLHSVHKMLLCLDGNLVVVQVACSRASADQLSQMSGLEDKVVELMSFVSDSLKGSPDASV